MENSIFFYWRIPYEITLFKRLPPEEDCLASAIGSPGLNVVDVFDSFWLWEELRMGKNVMPHNSLIFLADIIKIFPDW